MTGNRLWVFGTVVAMVIIVVLGWFLGVSPKLAEAESKLDQASAVSAQNATLEAALADLRETNDRLPELEEELADLRGSIPASIRYGDLVDTIYALSAANGLSIVQLSIAEPTAYGTDQADAVEAEAPVEEGETAAEPLPTAPEGTYTVRVTLEATGNPTAFWLLIYALQETERLVIVPSATFLAEKQTGTLTAFAFVMLDPTGLVPDEVSLPESDPDSIPTPTPTATPTPSPTPTPTP